MAQLLCRYVRFWNRSYHVFVVIHWIKPYKIRLCLLPDNISFSKFRFFFLSFVSYSICQQTYSFQVCLILLPSASKQFFLLCFIFLILLFLIDVCVCLRKEKSFCELENSWLVSYIVQFEYKTKWNELKSTKRLLSFCYQCLCETIDMNAMSPQSTTYNSFLSNSFPLAFSLFNSLWFVCYSICVFILYVHVIVIPFFHFFSLLLSIWCFSIHCILKRRKLHQRNKLTF